MRITRDFLLKTAATQAAFIAYNDPTILCIYLAGSCLLEEPLLGGSADIDLIAVHDARPKVPRVVTRLNDEISIDTAHYPRSTFDKPRSLRLDAWVGAHLIASPKILYDRSHWFEFTQAAIAPRYYAAETAAQRAQMIAQSARTTWMRLSDAAECTPQTVAEYLQNIKRMTVFVSTFSNPPCADRRVWLEFAPRVNALKSRNGFAWNLPGLFLPKDPAQTFSAHQAGWADSLGQISRTASSPAFLTPYRMAYYTGAAQALLEQNPGASLWIMLSTWSRAVLDLRANSKLHAPFAELCRQTGLIGEGYAERLGAMDAALDGLEEYLEQFCSSNGVLLST